MTLNDIETKAINPALYILPDKMDSKDARVLMLAIGLQESKFQYRWQVLNDGSKGPARGFWQFERGTLASRGGICGVFMHPSSKDLLKKLCEIRNCSFVPLSIWANVETDDVLAAGVARLLIYTDAQKLPVAGDEKGAWELYANRCWRPGKPHPAEWPANYAAAMAQVAKSSPG